GPRERLQARLRREGRRSDSPPRRLPLHPPRGRRTRLRGIVRRAAGARPYEHARAGRGPGRDAVALLGAGQGHRDYRNGAAGRSVTMGAIRILVVDDHEVVRMGLKALLELEQDFTVVAEAGDAEAALREARRHQPSVVIMDVRLGAVDGIEACRAVRSELP